MDDAMAQRFLEDGFVKIEGAFPPRVAEHCARLLWRETGYDPEDPGTWKDPVVWVGDMAQGPFAASVNSPALHEAFDLLVGAGRWQSRYSVGSFPLRFPHATEPDDAGWHIEGSYAAEGAEHEWPYANLVSRGRALLMLMLYSEVTEEDAPTRIRVGSHLDVPRVLAPYGEKGASSLALAPGGRGVRRGPSHTPPATPATSTSATPSWSTRPSRTTAPAPASWANHP